MKKRIGATLIKHKEVFYILTYERELFELNEIGARIFDLCNGVNTKEQIIEKLGMIFDIDKKILVNDIDKFINQLIAMSLIEK
ncbi:MAG: hypothetical protein K0R54_618 [Clostridiaceae bacterium]|jgi:acyl CoA:acetate/3-ketoacid CoA transferase|nr:hypothetical protein [Clostridiaceae bacterium]